MTAATDLLSAVDDAMPTYNCDVLIGLPDSVTSMDVTDVANNIATNITNLISIGYRLPSVSVYQLWDVDSIPMTRGLTEGLPLAGDLLRAKWSLQDALYSAGFYPSCASSFIRTAEDEHLWTRSRLEGFRHIGLGSGAYSILPDHFIQRPRDLNAYLRTGGVTESLQRLDRVYTLNADDLEIRRIILGLRTPVGVYRRDDDGIRSGSSTVRQCYDKIDRLIEVGFIRSQGSDIRLDNGVFLLANEILAYLHPDTVPRKMLAK